MASQALLLGYHNQSWRWSGKIWPVITGAIPFTSHGQELSTLLSYHLADGDDNSDNYAIGCCLMVDKDVHLARCASAYGESLINSLIRVLISRLGDEEGMDWEEVAKEMVRLVERFTIIIMVRRQSGSTIGREIYAFDLSVPLEAMHEALFSLPSKRLDENHPLNHLDPVEFNAISSLQSTLAAGWNDPSGVAARKLRRSGSISKQRRSGSDAEVDATSPVMLGQGLRRRITVTPRDVEIEGDESDELLLRYVENGHADLPREVVNKNDVNQEASYAASVREYELLLIWLRFLSQPDDQLLKKLDQQESYEERMRNLSVKLKETLSPEDLLRTLASISQ